MPERGRVCSGKWFFQTCGFFACVQGALALKNGLALKPPMGYNTWNAFHGDIDEDLVKATADLMIDLQLKDAGYEYLVMDGNLREPESDGTPRGHKKWI